MRVAAIDLGTVRVGLAVSDELGVLAHPRAPLDGRNAGRLVEALARLCESEPIDLVLVGLPRELSGREGRAAGRARHLARALAARLRARVRLIDERLSTVEARARLRDQGLDDRQARTRIDSAAAAVLLQSWLDARAGQP